MKKLVTVLGLVLITCSSSKGCSDAQVASRNLSEAAQNFEILRRIVFLNCITDKYLLVVEGFCSVDHDYEGNKKVVSVTCKKGPNIYFKHYLGLAESVTYFTQQLETADVKTNRHRVVFKPSVIIPDIELK